MPLYLYIKEVEGGIPIIHEVVQGMNETHEYAGPNGDEKGQWKRLWTSPEAAADSVITDPHDPCQFVRATNKKGTVGDLWERSEELSARRADKEGGRDPLKESFYKRFSKKHAGKRHPQQVREEGARKLKEIGIHLDWGDR